MIDPFEDPAGAAGEERDWAGHRIEHEDLSQQHPDEEESYTPEEMDAMAVAYGEAPPDPDDGYYYSGTGEWSGDDSYIDYLNGGR